jgi:hypothetical protein
MRSPECRRRLALKPQKVSHWPVEEAHEEEVMATYFMFGTYGAEELTKASIGLARLTGISFTSAQAIPVDRFDKLVSEI